MMGASAEYIPRLFVKSNSGCNSEHKRGRKRVTGTQPPNLVASYCVSMHRPYNVLGAVPSLSTVEVAQARPWHVWLIVTIGLPVL